MYDIRNMAKKLITKILIGFRLDPRLKQVAVKAAQQENRSLSNYIENLILKDVEERGFLEKRIPSRK